jgi:putative IMPACT (imprinted ancient) family translation regulator
MAARYRNPTLTEMSFDDGEPNGTAGRPMLNVLQMKKLMKVGCIVMRKFGGTLLGKGGLTKAYSDAVVDAVRNAVIGKIVTQKVLEGKFTYPQWSRIEKITLKYDSKLIAQFLEDVKVTMTIAPDELRIMDNEINQSLNGFNAFREIGEKQVFVRV